MKREYEIAVLGGGPGGYVAAIRAAQLGASVCLIEEDEVGGVCLNRGCIPTKTLVASARALSQVRSAADFGVSVDGVAFDFKAVMSRKQQVVERMVRGVKSLLKGRGIEVLYGRGKLVGPDTLLVRGTEGETEVRCQRVIIATGSEPSSPGHFEVDGQRIVTSDHILEIDEVSDSMLIVGAGAVGCEFASIFAEFGSKVTLVEMMPQILPGEEREVARMLRGQMRRQGIDVLVKKRVEAITFDDGSPCARLDSGEVIVADRLLACTGRRPSSYDIGLEEIGLRLMPDGSVVVNENMGTNVKGVYAVGDVTGKMLLAHLASAQGVVAAENAAGESAEMDYRAVPRCIFTQPEIGSVGMTEAEATEAGYSVVTGKFNFIASGKAATVGETTGFVKVVADGRGRLLGMSIIGPHATELVHEGVLAIRSGITVEEIARTIHAHPTLSECIVESCGAVDGQAIHML